MGFRGGVYKVVGKECIREGYVVRVRGLIAKRWHKGGGSRVRGG